MTQANTVSQMLEKVRKAAKLTVIEMAAIMQVSRQTYYSWLKADNFGAYSTNNPMRNTNTKRVRVVLMAMVALIQKGHDFRQTEATTPQERADELLAMLGIAE